jgi:hypothetical protein
MATGVSLAPDITRLDESRGRLAIEGRHGADGARAAALVARAGTGLYKLIRSPDTGGGARHELYLLDQDPDEWQDVATARPLHVTQLVGWLQAWLADCTGP